MPMLCWMCVRWRECSCSSSKTRGPILGEELDALQLMGGINIMGHRWRGNWSELDTGHWTPSFRQALDYNPDDAANFDNGNGMRL